MRHAFIRVVWVLPTLIAPAILLPACDSPGGPSERASPPLSIRIDGPSTLAPGASGQYTAVRVMPDGTTQPADVRWTVTPAALLQVTSTGMVTAAAGRLGDGTIQVEAVAHLGRRSQRVSREIVVLPDGTFRLAGTLFEADAANLPVPGARLEVSIDPDFALPSAVATTDGDGRYRLYGVPPDAYLRVTRDGYATLIDRVHLAAHETRNFTLSLSGERTDFSGAYAMVFEANCQGANRPVPMDLRRREYNAVIHQSGRSITATLTEPRFQTSEGQGNRFVGTATSRSITLTIRDFYNFYYNRFGPPHPDVAELLPDGTLLVVDGESTLTWSGGGGSGAWRGSMTHYSGQFPFPSFLGWCAGSRITLTRR